MCALSVRKKTSTVKIRTSSGRNGVRKRAFLFAIKTELGKANAPRAPSSWACVSGLQGGAAHAKHWACDTKWVGFRTVYFKQGGSLISWGPLSGNKEYICLDYFYVGGLERNWLL